ncbi:MAG: phytoene desaturase [Bacteroidetes bacterium]|nr:MAG: phytoene desaturase [Bacteroidota bacterium]MBL1145234.1 phytoene desaturase [Bacteroidota bacterium]NOG58030.1 phytoene desaturase [Bacteroidota bacterium]
MSQKKIAIIGSGFAGLAGASVLAQAKLDVHVFEKNESIGGRARQFKNQGFSFDMGPSWYWMPDVFDRFFERFGKSTTDYFELKKLDPGFQVIFNDSETLKIPGEYQELLQLFEDIESGAADKLEKFMSEAKYKYEVGVNDLVYQPGLSILELLRPDLMKGVFRLQVFSSFSNHVKKYFKDPRLISLMEFPILFLGAMPKDTPALYSLMNYAGLKIGTFYPMGGFGKLIDAMESIALEQGVQFHSNEAVNGFNFEAKTITHLTSRKTNYKFDAIMASADYHHVEQKLLPKELRNYTESYWEKRVFAPSSLLFYLGVNKKIAKLLHHNLFFDEDLTPHAEDIYLNKRWPKKPLFYVCCPSKTDNTVAPEGSENIFILMPVAPGIEDTDEIRETYFKSLLKRLENYTNEAIEEHIVFKKSYCIKDFQQDYNAYKGNAYGLANTLMQTANLKPKMRNKKVKNLFYAGQLTVPGPGVPPSLISGQVAAKQIINYLNQKTI